MLGYKEENTCFDEGETDYKIMGKPLTTFSGASGHGDDVSGAKFSTMDKDWLWKWLCGGGQYLGTNLTEKRDFIPHHMSILFNPTGFQFSNWNQSHASSVNALMTPLNFNTYEKRNAKKESKWCFLP